MNIRDTKCCMTCKNSIDNTENYDYALWCKLHLINCQYCDLCDNFDSNRISLDEITAAESYRD